MGWRDDVISGLHLYEAPDAAAGPTALDVTKTVSLLTAGTDGTQDLYTLADAQIRQTKHIVLLDGTDTVKITPANFGDNSYLELSDAGDYAVLEFNGAFWDLIALGRGATVT